MLGWIFFSLSEIGCIIFLVFIGAEKKYTSFLILVILFEAVSSLTFSNFWGTPHYSHWSAISQFYLLGIVLNSSFGLSTSYSFQRETALFSFWEIVRNYFFDNFFPLFLKVCLSSTLIVPMPEHLCSPSHFLTFCFLFHCLCCVFFFLEIYLILSSRYYVNFL